MRMSQIALLALIMVGLFAGQGVAGYEFRFADSSGNFTTSFNVVETSTVDIRVYLVQTGGDTGLSTSGLIAGGVGVEFNNAAAARVTSVGNISPNGVPTSGGQFDDSDRSLNVGGSNTTAVASVFQDGATGIKAVDNRILLGTFKFTGVTPGTSATLTVDPNPTGGFDDNVLANGTVLDLLITPQTATITVTAIPEPSSMALCGLAVVGFGGGIWRRWRQKRCLAVEPVAS